MRNSLITRFALPYIVLIFLVMVGLSLAVSYSLRNSYTYSLKTRLTGEARALSEIISDVVESNSDNTELQQLVSSYGQLLDSRITIILPDGQVVGESRSDASEMENHFSRPEIKAALAGEPGSDIRISVTLGKEYLYTAAPVRSNSGSIIAATRLAIPMTEVNTSIGNLNRAILTATGIATLLAIILAVVVANWTTLPVRRLTHSLRKIETKGIPDLQEPETTDEVVRLNHAFSAMSHQLQTQIDELVGERTKLSAVLNNMADGILIAGEDGTVQLINPAAELMFKTSAKESLGKSLVEVVRHHQLVELWHRCKQTGQPQTASYEISLEKIFVQAGVAPMDSGLPGSVLFIMQDLTRLRKLETLRRDFVSNVSHELRTPLASMKALTETLREGAMEDPPAAQRFLSRMDIEIDTLTQMVEELLELSRIESGRVPLENKPIQAGALIDKAVDRMILQAQRAGLSIEKQIGKETLHVCVDVNRMVQVLVNLLHNAIKFTPPGGSIQCGVEKSTEGIVFYVQDTGVGIDSESLPRIFERFYKADKARSGGGTGLGLSIARHLVEAHGGRIMAESNHGKGTKVSFVLPSSDNK